jgi:hypothetical protein
VFARSRVAWTYMSLAWLYEELGKLPLARQHLSAGMRLNDTLPANEPRYRVQFAYASSTLARLEHAAGRRARACALNEEAREHFQAGGSLWSDAQKASDQVTTALEKCRQ